LAVDAYDAIREIREMSFDACVADIVMPGSGFRVVSSLRALQPKTPIILMTAYDTVEMRARASENAVFAYLIKPAPPEQIVAVLKRAFEYHEALLKRAS